MWVWMSSPGSCSWQITNTSEESLDLGCWSASLPAAAVWSLLSLRLPHIPSLHLSSRIPSLMSFIFLFMSRRLFIFFFFFSSFSSLLLLPFLLLLFLLLLFFLHPSYSLRLLLLLLLFLLLFLSFFFHFFFFLFFFPSSLSSLPQFFFFFFFHSSSSLPPFLFFTFSPLLFPRLLLRWSPFLSFNSYNFSLWREVFWVM